MEAWTCRTAMATPLVGIFLFMTVGTALGRPIFDRARLDYPVPPGGTLATADFNGDGIPDLASGGTVLLGQGDRTFVNGGSYEAGEFDLAGDFNKDGIPDLAVFRTHPQSETGRESQVAISYGVGDGTFGSAQLINGVSQALYMSAGDLNEDGYPDLIVGAGLGDGIPSHVWILFKEGDGGYSETSIYDVGLVGVVDVEDMDEDQNLDIVAGASIDFYADSSGFMAILFGAGDGTFSDTTYLDLSGKAGDFTVGDFDEDGNLDIAAFENTYNEVDLVWDYRLILIRGQGNRMFGSPELIRSGRRSGWVDGRDFNQDGHLDLILGRPDSLEFLVGDGRGQFTERAPILLERNGLVLEDFDSDGILDLALNGEGFVSVLPGLGMGEFAMAYMHDFGGLGPVLLKDLNRDSHLDVALLQPKGLGIALGNGGGSFLTPSIHTVDGAGHLTDFAAGDLNGDDVPDLVAAWYPDQISVFIGDADGAFAAPVHIPGPGQPGDIVLADLDRDSQLDLGVLGLCCPYSIWVFRGDGAGNFGQPDTVGLPYLAHELVVSDLNSDQIMDLVVANDDARNQVSLYSGVGDGTFEAPRTLDFNVGDPPMQSTFTAGSARAADLDRDGIPDLVVLLTTSLYSTPLAISLAILEGVGDGSFVERGRIDANYVSAGPIVVGDIDNDMIPDIAMASESHIAVFQGDGAFGFSAPSFFGAGRDPNSLAIGDLNHDGRADIVAGSSRGDDQGVAVLLGGTGLVPVRLTRFEASLSPDGVILEWETAFEARSAGFHVLRSETDVLREATRLTKTLIPSGSHLYRFTDTTTQVGRYWYWLREVSRTGAGEVHGPIPVTVAGSRPGILLSQNMPNPFTASTRITFQMPVAGIATLEVFDISGRLVRTLMDGENVPAGTHFKDWDGIGDSGGSAAAGIYFYRLQTDSAHFTRRMLRIQ